jgi:hypothetical protein
VARDPELECDRDIGRFRKDQPNTLFREVPDVAPLRLVGWIGCDPSLKVRTIALTGSAFG